jgi:hypothetical protein
MVQDYTSNFYVPALSGELEHDDPPAPSVLPRVASATGVPAGEGG